MQAFGAILAILGAVIQLVGYIMLLVAAKRVSTGWLIGCLFGIVVPFFVVLHWSVARKAFLIMLAGMIGLGVGGLIVPDL